jgi:dihydroxyacetone kinase phosphotransfer subunit
MNRDSASDGHVGLVLVSHSDKIAAGVADLLTQVAGPDVRIIAVGGVDGGGLGINGDDVLTAVRRAAQGSGGVVLADIGSSVLATREALAQLPPAARESLVLADAPLIEGAVAAAVTAATGASLPDVARAAEDARSVRKL